MRNPVIFLAMSALIPTFASAQAEENSERFEFYGKANLDFQLSDEGEDSYSDLKSNASRIGIKGSLPLRDGIKAVYQMEYLVNLDGDGEDTFGQRDIFAGFEGGFGQIVGGKITTPLNAAQNKVDLFKDLEGDLKSIISNSENRTSNSLRYTSPSLAGIKATVSYINNKDEKIFGPNDEIMDTRDDGISSSLAYEKNNFYVAYAYDQNVENQNWDVQRWVAQYRFSNLQLGGLYEIQKQANGTEQDGWIASAAYTISDWTMKAQYGQSDVVEEGGETYSLGLDYKLSSAAKVYAFWTDETADADYERNYVGVGTEFKF
ncbi:MAG: porin [Gammaproteobacteria bacterium]|nr:porin [Gammaproteobacteria bacterium]